MLLRTTSLAALAALLLAAPAHAQEPGWDGEAEVGATVLFGNTSQSIVASRLEVGHADSTWEIDGKGTFKYGRSDDEAGVSHLSHRSWTTDGTVDYLPFATLSWFGLGGLESSFQRKIDLRWTAGAGAKVTFVRTDASLLDTSLALLAEKTSFDASVADPNEDLRARWSWRVRGKRTVADGRVVLESATFYRPVVDDVGDYVVETTNSAAYRLAEHLQLKLSLSDTYDSRAEARGARSNNDGQLLFSLLGSF